MRKVIQLLTLVFVSISFSLSAYGLTIYEADFDNQDLPGAWNWADNGGSHNVALVDDGTGNIVRQSTATLVVGENNQRFGSGIGGISVLGNTSADPADYFIEFDIVNVSGNLDPLEIGVTVLTYPAEGDPQGHGFPTISVTQAEGVQHVKYQLDEFTGNWWQGGDWDLTLATWGLEFGMSWPGITVEEDFTQVMYIDNVRIVMGSDTGANTPVVTPENIDGSVGSLVSQTEVEVILGWNAGGDPVVERGVPVNPEITGHYIYLSIDAPEDPNLYLLDYVAQTHAADPNYTEPYNEYGPITLMQGVTYTWKVEERIGGNPAGDPGNLPGVVWEFTTVAAVPTILDGPEHTLTDAAGNATMTVVGGPAATDFRWFKVGTPNVQLTDEGVYSGTQTGTLILTAATIAEEGEYYAIAYNGDPDNGGIASEPSTIVKLWTRRLMSHYKFESLTDGVTPDSVNGLDMTMMSDDEGTDLPVLAAGLPELAPDATGLSFDNSNAETPETYAQYAIAAEGIVEYKDITISLWVYWNGGGNWQRIIDFGNDTNQYLFLTPSNGGECRFAVSNGGEEFVSVPAIASGEWTMITATLSGDTARLYVNGQLEGTGTITHDPVDIAATLNYVGKSQYPDPFFNGIIDDMKVYSYARTTEEIAQDFLSLKDGWVCNNELYDLPYDFDGNCQVDIGDFAIFAAAWMDSYRIYSN